MTRIEIIESDDPQDFRKKVNEFIWDKEKTNISNARVHGPKLYDIKILDSRMQIRNEKPYFMAIIQY